MKKCFDCKRTYPLFMFTKNPRPYQRPEHQGKNLVCRHCTYKRWSRDMFAWVVGTDNKFERIDFTSKWQVIKRVLLILMVVVPACVMPPAREPKIMPIVVPVQDSVPFNPEGYTLEGEFEDDTIGQPVS